MNDNKFFRLFGTNKPIIGMIHLAGKNKRQKIKRALEELAIYEEESIDGSIIEDYHGDYWDVYETLRESETKFNLIRGINLLGNPYLSFNLATKFGCRFVQFDTIQTNELNVGKYRQLIKQYQEIVILGGVRFKYTKPGENSLKKDLEDGIQRCDAIVTTGEGTGIETPIEKLKEFRNLLEDFPLLVGAGVNLDNIYSQLKITDGAIIGSYFKLNGNTYLPVDRKKVKDLMDVVKKLREE